VLRDGVRGVLRELLVVREGEAVLDDGGVHAQGGGDHPHVGLGELQNGDAFALELLGGLTPAPRVVHDLLDGVPGGELTDLGHALQDPGVAVVDGAADVQVLVDPHDGAGGAFAPDVDPDPDGLAVLEVRVPDAGVPGAGRQP
jgi:hypothetical protein